MYYQEVYGWAASLLLVELGFVCIFLRWSLQISHKQIHPAEILMYVK